MRTTTRGPDLASLDDRLVLLSELRLKDHLTLSRRRIDRLFAGILVIQWITAIAIALTFSPRAWSGMESRIHPHVWVATILGGGLIAWPLCLSLLRPAAAPTRHALAVGQMLMGGLLIHLTSGRIETHFHVFGSLAFLSSYRDWRVLVTASLVAALDHMLRGIYWPQSVYGVLSTEPWRWTEHMGWILFTDAFLIPACMQGVRQMREIARGQALQDLARERVEAEVRLRTAELVESNDALAHEVAERRTAEANLRESEERFSLAVRGSSDGIWDWNCRTGQVYCSPRFKELLGYEEHEFSNSIEGFDAHIHPQDRGATWKAVEDHLQHRAKYAAEFRLHTKSGGYRWFQARGQAVWDDSGTAVRMVGSICDINERMRAEREVRDLNTRLERRLQRMDAVQRVDTVISASLDLRFTLEVCVEQAVSSLKVDAAAILLYDNDNQVLEYSTSTGFRTESWCQSRLSIGNEFAGRAAVRREVVHIPDLSHDSDTQVQAPLFASEGFVTYFAVPLVAKGRVKGVLEVFHRSLLEPDPEWGQFLKTHAVQTAIAVDNAQMFQRLEQSNLELTLAYDATIEGWSRALDLRDKETEGHTQRVTEMALRLARHLGVNGPELVQIRRGALLHDIGKMGVPDSILLKPGPLTDEERVVIERHPVLALEMLSPIGFLKPALDIPYCHHEKWDGTGYPRGLKGEQIPLAARIFAAIDIWDALRSDRPYRKGWTHDRVLEHIISLSGTHLDPQVVLAVVALHGDGHSSNDPTRPLGVWGAHASAGDHSRCLRPC